VCVYEYVERDVRAVSQTWPVRLPACQWICIAPPHVVSAGHLLPPPYVITAILSLFTLKDQLQSPGKPRTCEKVVSLVVQRIAWSPPSPQHSPVMSPSSLMPSV
jgi:hypothetical protein